MFSSFSVSLFLKIMLFMRRHGRIRQATDDNIIRCMRISCWITKNKETHSEYIILISFPWQQWLREGASLLRNTFIAFLVEKWQYLSTMIFLFLLQCVADISGGGVGWQKYCVSAAHKCCSDPQSCAVVVWKALNFRLRLSINMSECVHSLFCLADMAREVKCVCSGN